MTSHKDGQPPAFSVLFLSSLPLEGAFPFYIQTLKDCLILQQPTRLHQGLGQLLPTAWREKTAPSGPARMLWKGNFLFGFAV